MAIAAVLWAAALTGDLDAVADEQHDVDRQVTSDVRKIVRSLSLWHPKSLPRLTRVDAP